MFSVPWSGCRRKQCGVRDILQKNIDYAYVTATISIWAGHDDGGSGPFCVCPDSTGTVV
jgi:hypothetical protein